MCSSVPRFRAGCPSSAPCTPPPESPDRVAALGAKAGGTHNPPSFLLSFAHCQPSHQPPDDDPGTQRGQTPAPCWVEGQTYAHPNPRLNDLLGPDLGCVLGSPRPLCSTCSCGAGVEGQTLLGDPHRATLRMDSRGSDLTPSKGFQEATSELQGGQGSWPGQQ